MYTRSEFLKKRINVLALLFRTIIYFSNFFCLDNLANVLLLMRLIKCIILNKDLLKLSPLKRCSTF